MARLVCSVLVFAVLFVPVASADPWFFAGTQVDGNEVCILMADDGPHWTGCTYEPITYATFAKDIAVGVGVGGLTACVGVHIDPNGWPTPYTCIFDLRCHTTKVCEFVERQFFVLP